MKMQVDVPKDINLLLRKYALESELGSREKATIYILKNFLIQFYKTEVKNG